MPTERCSLPAFLFLDGLQNLILIAAAIYNAKDNDILFLLINQVIGKKSMRRSIRSDRSRSGRDSIHRPLRADFL